MMLQFPVHAFAETIRLASGEWSPYQSKTLKDHGFVSRIITESFAAFGDEVTYAYFPWKRAFENARRGEHHGTFLWFKTKTREKDFYFSDPVVDVTYSLYHLSDRKIEWESLPDLKKYRIGASLGYSYGQAFDNAMAAGELEVQRVSTDRKNFIKVLGGRIDVFPCETRTAQVLLSKHFSLAQRKRLKPHPKLLVAEPHYLLMPKALPQSKQRIERFNQGLKRLKADGRYQKYLEMKQEKMSARPEK